MVLTQVFRQKNQEFVDCLNELRVGKVSDRTAQLLAATSSGSSLQAGGGIEPTRLHSHNGDVDRANSLALSKLQQEVFEYHCKDTGSQAGLGQLANCQATEVIQLKVGAQVILLKNIDPANGLPAVFALGISTPSL